MVNNRLIVAPGGNAGVILGTFDVFGSNSGSETLTIFDDTIVNLQGDFARGGDTVRLRDVAGDFVVSLSGSNAVLTSASDAITVRIPVSSLGIRVVFENSSGQLVDERLLLFNGNNVILGNQVVTATPTQVSANFNTPPVVVSPIPDQTLAEDTTWAFTLAGNVFGDADGNALTLTAALADGSALPSWVRFTAPTRTFSGTPPANFNGDIDLRVSASDGIASVSDVFRLSVTPVNDVPVITSGNAQFVLENQTAVFRATAFDVDGDPLSFSLSGPDAGLFNIVASNGVVSFKTAPDFEAPADANADNQYDLVLFASDGKAVTSQMVTITVRDVVERAVIDLTSLAPSQGFIIQGDTANDRAGRAVANAGDINGDGIDDVIIGAGRGDDGGSYAGEAYVVFGSASGFGTADASGRRVIDLTSLTPAQGFIIQGDAEGDIAGHAVQSAGDINGDGFDDLIIGAVYGDDGGYYAGEAYVVFGSDDGFGVADATGRKVIDLTTLTAAQGFILQGASAFDFAGISVDSAGDINGDGFEDLIIGAVYSDGNNSNPGRAYVVFGSAGGFGTPVAIGNVTRQVVNLGTLTPAQGVTIVGSAVGDVMGYSVAAAGDVNGDGFDDVVIGAKLDDDGGTDAGVAYVLFGSRQGFGIVDGTGKRVIDLASLTEAQGFLIQGDAARDQAGYAVTTAGDVNGDGFDDLLISAPFGDDGGDSAGETYVVFGAAGGFGTADASGRRVIDLTSLGAGQGFVIQGDAAGDRAGRTVGPAGDINGDGYDDVIVGASYADDGGLDAGSAYVVYGSAGNVGTADASGRRVIDLTRMTAAQGFVIQGDAAADYAGFSVSMAGDVDGDGFDDLIVGARTGDDGGLDAGEAYVIFGGRTGTEDTTPRLISGTAAAESLIGKAGDDVFLRVGRGDVVRGGAGNDRIEIGALDFADIRGGNGTDTLALTGSGLVLDLTGTPRPRIDSIEIIDLTGSGNNVLILNDLALFRLSEMRAGGEATLIVKGNAGDRVEALGFVANGTQVLNGMTYLLYEKGNANLLLAPDVQFSSTHSAMMIAPIDSFSVGA